MRRKSDVALTLHASIKKISETFASSYKETSCVLHVFTFFLNVDI